ncbi:MAG TPA: molybdenum cofactor biosynthesis protein MoaE [Devosia sp.]|nr:molybdenum cofactor biosynthesis protein MoaE [Devosia sp.]
MIVRLQSETFDPGAESNAFLSGTEAAGAAVTFTGLVRSTPDNPILSMTLEHYPALAQSQLEKISKQAFERFSLIKLTTIHRYGTLAPGEPIVQVMTLAGHRKAAFEGAQFLMDYLKTGAPFWKKERSATGENWVAAKTADDSAKERWE